MKRASKRNHTDGFMDRTSRFLTKAAECAAQWYDANGNWLPDSRPSVTRERFWIAFALYSQGKESLADAVVRNCQTPKYGKIRFDIFDNNEAAQLLVRHASRMAPDVRKKLETLVRDGFSFKPGNRQPDYQYHGYNDNMPSLGTMGLILGGEWLGNAQAVEYGLWNLRQMRAQLYRRGINSEFNSPTYSPGTLSVMAAIVEHARNAEAKETALAIEERLWIDFAARYHPETGLVAGPYSRTYTADTVGHLSCLSSLLWFVLGQNPIVSTELLFDPPQGLVLHHEADVPFNIAQMCAFASKQYHVPPLALRLFRGKRYPFRAVASCEIGNTCPDFPARPCRIETVLHPDYTLGTSSTTFHGGGHTLHYFVSYRRCKSAQSFRDVGTVFSKFAVNDEIPGMPGQGPYARNGEQSLFASYANSIALQSDSTALVLNHPHLALGGGEDDGAFMFSDARKRISRLSDMVVFPSHCAAADEILVGGQKRDSWDGSVADGEWIACRRGRLLIAIRPMAYSKLFGPARITLEKLNQYEVIRFDLYHGRKRFFSRKDLRHMFSGFVAEHASVDEFPSLSAFVQSLKPARFMDYFWLTRRVRYSRAKSAKRPALELEASWSPGSQNLRIATINGKSIDTPVIDIDGVKVSELPIIKDPFEPVPPCFPWQKLEVQWDDWSSTIHDRGV